MNKVRVTVLVERLDENERRLEAAQQVTIHTEYRKRDLLWMASHCSIGASGFMIGALSE